MASLRAPGTRPGLAVSDFTRRSGFVSIVDIGPTILDVFGVAAPDSMEGRPMDFGRTGGSFAERRSFLIDSNVGAVFRDERIGPVTIAFIAAQVFLTLAAAIAFTWLGRRSRRVIEIGALSLLGVIPATFLAVLLPFDRHAVWLYWLFIGGVGAVIGIGSYVVTDRRGVGPLVVCLGAIVALLVGDIVTGARLQFNTVFGYSPTVAGRFAGIGNLAYSSSRRPRSCSRACSRTAWAAAAARSSRRRCWRSRSSSTACRSGVPTSAVCCRWSRPTGSR